MSWLRRKIRKLRGGRSHDIKETVKLRSPITWDRFDQACYAMNLDPDAVRTKGREAWKGAEWPSLDQMQEFVDLIVDTPGKYDLRRDFETAAAKAFVASLMGFFLIESQMNSNGLDGSQSGSSKQPAFQFQMGKAFG